MDYVVTKLKKELMIDEIVTVHYFEYTNDYYFSGETHNFWEFLYVDKGEVEVTAGNKQIHLIKGQIVFHKPNEFHNLWANGVVAPNLMVCAFVCNSPAMDFFKDKILTISEKQKEYLAQIVSEAQKAYISPLNDPDLKQLVKSLECEPGSEQIISICLEMLLLDFIRRGNANQLSRQSNAMRRRKEQDIVEQILQYFEKNISRNLTLEETCKDNFIGKSYIQKLFRSKTGGGVMEYFGRLRIEAAKQLIREGKYNFTEISQLLGYASIHYFSRHFKKISGMTPSEYNTSIKVLSSNDRCKIEIS